MKVLVCGSRDWMDKAAVKEALDLELDTLKPGDILTVIEGGARGADFFAGEWAEEHFEVGVEWKRFPADWNKYGKRAGYIRNQQMLDEGKPDLVVAFWDGQSRGTKMMIDLAKKAKVEVKVINGTL